MKIHLTIEQRKFLEKITIMYNNYVLTHPYRGRVAKILEQNYYFSDTTSIPNGDGSTDQEALNVITTKYTSFIHNK